MNPPRRPIGKLYLQLTLGVALLTAAVSGQAKDYCCVCEGQTAGKTISSFNQGMAIGQCSMECGSFTNVTAGKCPEPPPAAAPAPAPAPAPARPTGVVLVYQSEDCSGNPIRVEGSIGRVSTSGLLSFQVESGGPASVFEKPDYAGRGTAPVAGSMCIAPGFEIQSVRLQ